MFYGLVDLECSSTHWHSFSRMTGQLPFSSFSWAESYAFLWGSKRYVGPQLAVLIGEFDEKGLEEILPCCTHTVQQVSSVSPVVVKYICSYFCRYLSVQSIQNDFQILSQLSRIVVMAIWQRYVLLGNALGWKRFQGSLSLFWWLPKTK